MGCYALLSIHNTTLFQLPYLLKSDTFRSRIVGQLKDPVFRDYWSDFDDLKRMAPSLFEFLPWTSTSN